MNKLNGGEMKWHNVGDVIKQLSILLVMYCVLRQRVLYGIIGLLHAPMPPRSDGRLAAGQADTQSPIISLHLRRTVTRNGVFKSIHHFGFIIFFYCISLKYMTSIKAERFYRAFAYLCHFSLISIVSQVIRLSSPK